MTRTDVMTARANARPARATAGRTTVVWIFAALAFVVLPVGLAGGVLPGQAGRRPEERQLLVPARLGRLHEGRQRVARSSTRCSPFPGFVVYQRDGGLTAADKAKIAGRRRRPSSPSRASPATRSGSRRSSPTARTIAVAARRQAGRQVRYRARSGQGREEVIDTAEGARRAGWTSTAPAPAASSSRSSTPSAVSTASLLLAAGLVVIILLLIVYRSPVLWFFPLFSAVLALGAAPLVIYPLAKNGTITLNGQSQGILSVLVIGAGTDYALLLISRYREELHEHRSRVARHDRRVARRGATDRGFGGHRHPRSDLPGPRRPQLDAPDSGRCARSASPAP